MSVRCQPRVAGGRKPVGGAVIKEIERRVRRDSREFGVSKSWIVACALGKWFGVRVVKYIEAEKPRRRRRK